MTKTVLLGITSGIAAYKTIDLIKSLKQDGIEVKVIMTKHATHVVKIEEIEQASGYNVFSELFDEQFDYKEILKIRKVDHIELADNADVVVIAPATANIIAKLAHGIADDFLTTTMLAVTKPIIICPSMNVNMWKNPIVQENLNKLRERNYIVIEPTSGMLACGYEGEGRLANIPDIKNSIEEQLSFATALKDKKIIVTAGGTREKIDEVRYLTNRSSGKMGIAIAETCHQQGAEVLLLRSKTSVKPKYHMHEELFDTASELQTLIEKYIKDFDMIYHVAAVSDFSIEQLSGKLQSDQKQTLELSPRKKILNEIKNLNPKIKLIAFKAEANLTENELIEQAKKRLQESNADAIIANDIGKNDRGFEVDQNEVVIVLADGTVKKLPLAPKKEIAKQIVIFANSYVL